MKLLLNNTEVAIIDLGEVKIGEAQTYEYTLENDSGWDVKEIELSLEDIKGKPVTEINFKVKPTKMEAHSNAPLVFTWTPGVEIKSGLKTQLQIKAFEIWK